jgi:hypothetical protein
MKSFKNFTEGLTQNLLGSGIKKLPLSQLATA